MNREVIVIGCDADEVVVSVVDGIEVAQVWITGITAVKRPDGSYSTPDGLILSSIDYDDFGVCRGLTITNHRGDLVYSAGRTVVA